MLLRRLVLEDFGLFRGRNELDLTPRTRYRQRRPVILIGGKNGSGKTTLLEALRLGLYGPLALGNRVSVREYEGHLADRIHRAEGGQNQPSSAAVGMEFEYAQAGISHIYWVERRWEQREGSVKNFLTVLRDGKPLDELDRAHADDFLRDLIPPGVSQLFFFDGEKIQQLAESDQDNLALAEAIRGLIGLEILERLQGDLRVYAARVRDSAIVDPLLAERASLDKEHQVLEQQRRDQVKVQDGFQAQLDHIRQNLSREEQRLARAAGGFAKQRGTLEAESEQLSTTIAETETELRGLCEGLLPFTLAAGLSQVLRRQLDDEGKVLTWNIHQAAIQSRLAEIKKKIGTALVSEFEVGKLDPKVRKSFAQRLGEILDQLVEPPKDLPQVPLIHKQSEDDRRRLVIAIDRLLDDIPRQLATIQKRLERSIRRNREVEAALDKIPRDDVIEPILEQIQGLQRELGSNQASLDRAIHSVGEIDLKLADIARKEKSVREKIANVQKATSRSSLVVKVQAALEDYSSVLTTSKINELRESVVRCFSQLWRKGDLVRRIEIDARDFRVTLLDGQDRVVPKQQLSAGEKQIYAISMLWALAQVSGRPLPMVIDTPLGRLDRDHRGHLVDRYFPHASHQVIILSTDTEIDQTYFRALGPSISHSYHLQYDTTKGRCFVEEGYFWDGQEKEAANAGE